MNDVFANAAAGTGHDHDFVIDSTHAKLQDFADQPANRSAGRPGTSTSTAKSAPASERATSVALRPIAAEGMNNVLKLGPPRVQLVTCDAGIRMLSMSSPCGLNRDTRPPPQCATHRQSSWSHVKPSG